MSFISLDFEKKKTLCLQQPWRIADERLPRLTGLYISTVQTEKAVSLSTRCVSTRYERPCAIKSNVNFRRYSNKKKVALWIRVLKLVNRLSHCLAPVIWVLTGDGAWRMWSIASQRHLRRIISLTDDGFKSESRNTMFHKRAPSKDQRGVRSFPVFPFNFSFESLSLSASLSLSLALSSGNGATVEVFGCCMIYSLLCFFFLFFYPLLLECLVGRTGNFEPRYKANVYLGHTRFSDSFGVCACPWRGCSSSLPSSSESFVWWLGRLLSSPPRSSLKWESAGCPDPRGGWKRRGGREGGRGQGRRGWELNNGWFLIEIRPENRGGERVITCKTELNA